MRPVVFLNSHPIQYFVPLYQQIASTTDIDLEVLYCSDESVKGKVDKGFGKSIIWDIPLLSGYNYVFLKNRSLSPSIHTGFWGLFNPSIIKYLYRKPASVLIVHGWASATHIMAIIAGKLAGHKVCIRAETPQNQELLKNRYITFIKHIYLRFIFLFVDRFLFIGAQNRLFYKALGINNNKMTFVPYCVDNARFRTIFEQNTREDARLKLQLPIGVEIILYSGKYIEKKRPLDLLKAFNSIDSKTAILVLVGDGELRAEMEAYISEHSLTDRVILTGFINQSLIPFYYRAADVFVMCSGLGETWGLSVNEAMNFGLPVIVSDTCGSSYDLVKNDLNGKVFETGNIDQLQKAIQHFLGKTEVEKKEIVLRSLEIVDQYSYHRVIEAIMSL